MEHLFLYCLVARALWDYSGLEYLGQGLPCLTFPLFLKKLMSFIHQPDLFMAIVAVLWRIWRSRNWVVFEGKQYGFPSLMRQYHQQYEEWVNLPLDRVPRYSIPVVQQSGPVGGRYGCLYVGWGYQEWFHSTGGMVILTPDREVLLAKGIQFPVIDDPMVVELLVLREAILWCQGLGFTE
ncbi:unnamed protein product [Linum trigynum]|uniref:Uncharacterized protein n=1 Tax=Linum trigynum TaxID=586398 RepID=A0AAV2GWZ4_9ROSI